MLEAKARVAAGEYEGKFGKFLLFGCKDLSSSRAYELMAIAQGTKTVEGIRKEVNARAAKAARERRPPIASESSDPLTNQPLSAPESDESAPPKKKRGGQVAPKTPSGAYRRGGRTT